MNDFDRKNNWPTLEDFKNNRKLLLAVVIVIGIPILIAVIMDIKGLIGKWG